MSNKHYLYDTSSNKKKTFYIHGINKQETTFFYVGQLIMINLPWI